MIIKLLIDGGDMKPGPAVAQQLGPMGINIGKVISEINKTTQSFKGMKVPVELNVNEKTKEFIVKTSSPPTAELLKKELNLEKGSNDHKNIKVGNASIEDIIKVAKIKHPNMLEKDLKTAVKSILGTCMSVGILVENKEVKELIEDFVKGKFDKEILKQSTETTIVKRNELNDYFTKVKVAQNAKIEQEKKAAEEAEKKAAEEAPKEGAVAKIEGAKPGAGSAVKPSEAAPAKKEEKKPEKKK